MTTTADQPDLDDPRRLLAQLRAGSRQAFAELVRRYQGPVRAFLARFVRSAESVDDLAQEVFLAAYRQLPAFAEVDSVPAWLLGVARNQALQHLRGELRRRQREGVVLEAALARGRLERAEAADPETLEAELAALRECLQRLPAASRETVEAHYFAGRTAEAIAAAGGRTAGAVRIQLLRLRRALGVCIRRHLGREEA